MKKRIIFLIVFIIIIAMFSGCKNNDKIDNNDKVTNNDKEQVQIVEKPLNETYEINDSTVKLGNELGENAKTLGEAEIVQKYNFDSLGNLEKKVMINNENGVHEEVAIVKLTNETQDFKIQQILYNRYEDLKKEYKDNEEMMKILQDGNNVKIKIQDGVGILIISDRANELMKTFDYEFQ